MRDDIDMLHERLLRQGVSPKWARRYREELGDHLADLTEALVADGHVPEEAAQLARQQLGDVEALAAAATADPGAMSLAARLPALAYVAVPLLAVAGIVAGIAAILVAVAPHTGLADFAWLPAAGELVGPTTIAWTVAAFALGRRARAGWPLAGMIATLALGAAIDLDVTMPSAIGAGAVAVALGGPDTGILLVSILATLPAFLLIHARLKAI